MARSVNTASNAGIHTVLHYMSIQLFRVTFRNRRITGQNKGLSVLGRLDFYIWGLKFKNAIILKQF